VFGADRFLFLASEMPPCPKTKAQNQNQSQNAPTIVIIHGAWGGSHHWKAAAELLQAQEVGEIYRVALTGLGPRVHLASKEVNLETHIQDVLKLVEFEDLSNVVVVAHSYGGIVASGVADRVPQRISKILYLDASLLEDGECFFTGDEKYREDATKRAEEDGDGFLIPVDWPNDFGDAPHPLATLTDAVKLKNPLREKIPASYWIFTDGKPLEKDSRLAYYNRAKDRGYALKDFTWGHNPQRQHVAELAEALAAEIQDYPLA
jgi:pimeloyl-ACP methyl ester carboxylesterase